jgi:hypothetical protein
MAPIAILCQHRPDSGLEELQVGGAGLIGGVPQRTEGSGHGEKFSANVGQILASPSASICFEHLGARIVLRLA